MIASLRYEAGFMIRADLKLVFWELTAGCNLSCLHCRRLEVSKELSKKDLSTQACRELIRQIADTAKPILVFSGGEPLLRPDLFDLVDEAKSRGLETAIATNGTLIDGKVAQEIKRHGVRRVAVSLDGPSSVIHDGFRGEKGAFDKTILGCMALRRSGISLQINSTLARHNAEYREELYQLAIALGADAFHLFMLVPVGCGLEIAKTHQLTGAEYEEILRWLYQKSLEKKIHVRATCAPHYFRIIREESAKEKRPLQHSKSGFQAMTRGCLAGTSICFISHKGEIFPCGYLPVTAGRFPDVSFESVWRDSPAFLRLRNPKELLGKCGICEFKKVCMGCRARAFYETGNFMEEEPFCTYEPEDREAHCCD